MQFQITNRTPYPVSILHKSTAGRYADGPITARCRFIKNASWVNLISEISQYNDKFCDETKQWRNGDLKPEHKETTNKTMKCPTTGIDSLAITFCNRLRREPSFSLRREAMLSTIIGLTAIHAVCRRGEILLRDFPIFLQGRQIV